MTTLRTWSRTLKAVGAILILGASISACSSGGLAWKEEVLLHDRCTIVVERSQTYGGRSEIGQFPPINEPHLSFQLPRAGTTISWTSEYGEELGRANFKLLALHVMGDIPFLVSVPKLCLSYNKCGRANQPYVISRYDMGNWNRIGLQELSVDFKTNNLMINTLGEQRTIAAHPLVSAAFVELLSRSLEPSEYRTILREKIETCAGSSLVNCEVLVSNGRGGWLATTGLETSRISVVA